MENFNLILVITILYGSFIILILLLGFYAYRKTDHRGAVSYRKLFGSNFNRIIIFLFIIYTTAILTIIGKINNEIITLFSSMAGFILGGINNTCKGTEEEDKKKVID